MSVKLFTAKNEVVIHVAGVVKVEAWFCCEDSAREWCSKHGCGWIRDEYIEVRTGEAEYRSLMFDIREIRKIKVFSESGLIIIKP